MKTAEDVLKLATETLYKLPGKTFDVVTVGKPKSLDWAIDLSKIISKLSPIVGNLIEFDVVDFLNKTGKFSHLGAWKRQDPGFPDTIFESKIRPAPGFEVKAWFPLATEITARFKDSQNYFLKSHTHVAMLAWLPEFILFGKPKIVDIVIVTGGSIAQARDDHYHKPPDYLVIEPEDTSSRTANLQQSNTSGYKFQGDAKELAAAKKLVDSWGPAAQKYQLSQAYQKNIRQLIEKYKYRLDTNYAKMDRIAHTGIEAFKQRVFKTEVQGLKISEWQKLLTNSDNDTLANAFRKNLKLK